MALVALTRLGKYGDWVWAGASGIVDGVLLAKNMSMAFLGKNVIALLLKALGMPVPDGFATHSAGQLAMTLALLLAEAGGGE